MHFVIVGGGISGVNCSMEILKSNRNANIMVTLISASRHVKTVTNWYKIGQFTENFEVSQTDEPLTLDTRFRLIYDTTIGWDSIKKYIELEKNGHLHYDKLCIATGASPICPFKTKNVLTIRDTDTALDLQKNLVNSKHVVIVGNGGIATELVYELKNIKITWIIRDSTVSSSFFPKEVEQFILPKLLEGRNDGLKNDRILKREKYTTSTQKSSNNTSGPALGPDWCTSINLCAKSENKNIEIITNSEVVNISGDTVVEYKSKNNVRSTIPCDFVVWATGSIANSKLWKNANDDLVLASNSGIKVNDIFETSVPDVYACGDVCTVELNDETSTKWKQMHLWTQARQSSETCAKTMLFGRQTAEMFNIHLELYAHCTTFFGLKVVFLGDYKPENAEKGTWRIVERVVGKTEYVRCVLVDGKMCGALLIGDTNLEETMENMIMNETDLTGIENTFLDPSVEIDDFFD